MKHSERSILLVDDDDNLRRVMEYQLTHEGYTVKSVPSGDEALKALSASDFELVITDILMPEMDGIELLRRVTAVRPDLAVIMVTAHGDVTKAVLAMKLGALDFLEKPFGRDRLLLSVRRALDVSKLRDENRRLRAVVQEHDSFENLVGSSPALRSLIDDLKLAAESDATVVLHGESGTGKELAARAIHLNSRRKQGPFIVVNCGAIPESLIESELFGHVRGAFTGADEERVGKFELADGGTIFLDEIAELPLALQPKLLRALQEGEADKIGAGTPVNVDVRVVAATHDDIQALIRRGSFREDLWYRLNVVPLRLPPLRERTSDISLLANHFLVKHARRHRRPVPTLLPEVFDRLERYPWPGNVRELENLMERIVVLAKSETVGVGSLPEDLRDDRPRWGGLGIELPPGGIVLDEVERGLIDEALRRSDGNQSAAARLLGLTRQTLLYRMQKHDLR